MKSKLLTKSRFKLAIECPTKLYYGANKEYVNKKVDDPFLQALARGGFQVGELAKAYYPGGHDILTMDKDLAISKTNELLQQDEVIIYEPAIQIEDYFIRVDILKKVGNSIHLIEVKAKSFDPDLEDQFYDKRLLKKGFKQLTSKWKSYLYDVAFQKAVTQLAFPDMNITSSLMLADKSKVATVDGLNQMFFISKDRDRMSGAKRIGDHYLGEEVLITVNVDTEVNLIINGEDQGEHSRTQLGIPSFHNQVRDWAKSYIENQKVKPELGSKCKTCEFKANSDQVSDGQKSGFTECWGMDHQEAITSVWNYRGVDKLLAQGIKKINEMNEEDINPESDGKPGMSAKERQWFQVDKYQRKDMSPETFESELASEINSWTYPYNFIDFETSMVALPFNKGRRPYEQIAFQFSHHILYADGRVEHANEFIFKEVGKFPNFEFVRALKKTLEVNNGSIFRYSNHENTVLLQIYDQLQDSDEFDRDELCAWIETITQKKDGKKILWTGPRNMIDQWEVVKRFYYHPKTNGSNSIKQVLPAVLFESARLKQKYSQPIYGASGGIKSLNFKDWTWLKLDEDGEPIDPYKQLEPPFDDYDTDQLDDLMFEGGEIKDGGAAATGYAMMQFSQMSEIERERITKALLRYCELDTLAMVMITEHWLEVLKHVQNEAV